MPHILRFRCWHANWNYIRHVKEDANTELGIENEKLWATKPRSHGNGESKANANFANISRGHFIEYCLLANPNSESDQSR